MAGNREHEEEEVQLSGKNSSSKTPDVSFEIQVDQIEKYISLYNGILAVGWICTLLYVLFKILRESYYSLIALRFGLNMSARDWFFGVFYNLFFELRPLIIVLEGLLLLHFIHGYFGLVIENRAAPLWERVMVKTARRLHLLLFTLFIAPAVLVQHSSLLGFMTFTWAMSDAIKYSYYTLAIMNKCPYWLYWLKNTHSVVQYPLNTLAELLYVFFLLWPVCASQETYLPTLRISKNFAIHYGCVFAAQKLIDLYYFPSIFKNAWRCMLRVLYPDLYGYPMDTSEYLNKSKQE
jgi:hypothetical protein